MATWRSWRSSRRGAPESPAAGRAAARALAALWVAAALMTGLAAIAEPRRPAVVAHRGGAALWPENSLAAFQGALALGVDAVELDVHLSQDDEVVVLHDPTLDRTTSGQGPVRAHAWPALSALALRGAPGERLPRLEDVLALLKPARAGLLLEIKTDGAGRPYPRVEEYCLALVIAAGLLERTTFMAFEWEILARLRARSREARLAGLLSARGAARLGGLRPATARLRALGANDLGIERTLLRPDAVAAARAAGLALGVWTVNDPAELRHALASGVDSVTTDRPDLALRLRDGGS